MANPESKNSKTAAPPRRGRPGRVIETAGRRVVVADSEGSRMCFLSGHRAIVGDRVTWEEARGEGGKLVSVEPRDTVLRRVDPRGEEQLLAANLRGVLIVASASSPEFHAPLVDRYLVTASMENLHSVIVLTKVDLGVPDPTEEALEARAAQGVRVLRCSTSDDDSIHRLDAFLVEEPGAWAMVGHSGVGKTSLVAKLFPTQDVGPIGDISTYWDAGRHTTTRTRSFTTAGGGEIVDSPGIRGFIPAIPDPERLREHFPGVCAVECTYRDCMHRVGEEGCNAEAEVLPTLLNSYRGLLRDAENIHRRRSPGGR